MQTTQQPSTKTAMPMFYQSLVALNPARHLGWGIRKKADLSCTRTANAVPLGVGEFWQASHYYPIVFGPAEKNSIPIAITGLVEGSNLLLDANNQWLEGHYVPGWIKRYPFWMQTTADQQHASIWFDQSANLVVPLEQDDEAQPLFNYLGQPNIALEAIITHCKHYQNDSLQTIEFIKALEELNLLVDRSITLRLSNDDPYTLNGFRIVDKDAYYKLPDSILAQWSRKGWNTLVELHLLSIKHNWTRLLDLYQQKT